MAAENTTAALTTQPACVIISHTLEFFWYNLYISCFTVSYKAWLGLRDTEAHLKVLVTVWAPVAAVHDVVVTAKWLKRGSPAEGAQGIINKNELARLDTNSLFLTRPNEILIMHIPKLQKYEPQITLLLKWTFKNKGGNYFPYFWYWQN